MLVISFNPKSRIWGVYECIFICQKVQDAQSPRCFTSCPSDSPYQLLERRLQCCVTISNCLTFTARGIAPRIAPPAVNSNYGPSYYQVQRSQDSSPGAPHHTSMLQSPVYLVLSSASKSKKSCIPQRFDLLSGYSSNIAPKIKKGFKSSIFSS